MNKRTMTRRRFLRNMGTAAAGLLAASCQPEASVESTELSLTPTAAPSSTSTLAPTSSPTSAPTATPRPTATPLPAVTVRRPEMIRIHPDVASRVVSARHQGVWDGDVLQTGAVRQMLDASITALSGLNDAQEAWSALFAPGERVAIKVNVIRSSLFWTHLPLVIAVTECLQQVGIPAEQIVIFDRATGELDYAGYPVNRDGDGVRCFGTDSDYTGNWTLVGDNIQFSNILLSCHALINIPILKQHGMGGISFALKNHYGTFDRPRGFHGSIQRALPELNALSPIKDRTRLIIGDALAICQRGWKSALTGDSILMSFDPVAHDTIGLQRYEEAMAAEGFKTTSTHNTTIPWLKGGTEIGLGAHNPQDMDLVEVSL